MENQWKNKLTPEQYRVLRSKDTEAPFSGKLLHENRVGVFCCAACGTDLFKSDHKFDSGSGWPSFFESADPAKIKLEQDDSLGNSRTEVTCANCGGHLGHLFNDAPKTPSGNRFCINSVSLDFKPKDKAD